MEDNKNNKQEKYNYRSNKLSPKQEVFVDEILKGKTQIEAYRIAYPRSKDWTYDSAKVAASHLMDNEKVQATLKEYGYANHKQAMWTRQKALDTINYVMDMNRADMERIAEACQTEIDLYEAKLMQKGQEMAAASKVGNQRLVMQVAKEMQDITETIQKLKKQKRTNSTNIKGIFEGAKILNRMFGFDITKVEISNSDTERDEMNKLTAEELKEILKKV